MKNQAVGIWRIFSNREPNQPSYICISSNSSPCLIMFFPIIPQNSNFVISTKRYPCAQQFMLNDALLDACSKVDAAKSSVMV